MAKRYDVVIIGGGSGGLTVASGAASFGQKVALINESRNLGGDCLHYGCVPSKALIQAAKEVKQAEKAAGEFGLTLGGKADFNQAKARIQAAKKEIQKHDDPARFESAGVDVFEGTASFIDQHKINVKHQRSNTVLKGKKIVIATGSSPKVPEIEGLAQVPYITNEDVYTLSEVPARVAVAGGGPVGVELAQALARFGARVDVIHAGAHLFETEDETIAFKAEHKLAEEMNITPNYRLTKAAPAGSAYRFTAEHVETKSQKEITADVLFVAAGRKPNTDKLNIEAAGINCHQDGTIKVDQTMRTSREHIFAVGDAAGAPMFTHAAGIEGQTVVANLAFDLKQKIDPNGIPWTFFTDPGIFHLGMTEAEAVAAYGEEVVNVYEQHGGEVDRFIAEHKPDAYAKIITDRKNRIIGAHAVGEDPGDWMQELVYLYQKNEPLKSLSSSIYPYPARGEIIKKAADKYWRDTLFHGRSARWLKRISKLLR
ncbi:pyruvate/2-oxoglutarate dehydrogenase complex dihydrolipoamide dehydrogenase (E3) component [Salsuginibacillus halophilus]|uniref:Pyruvate/2-oxoglutarate dehydrogenase complex dihydrolipoamide dehydrogenase (E3) component n=1 Tax=Salsuginibacillus halophilus TaxID=517424 RepID=A0A2P8H8Q1_9BACI|nr:FAD-dependent oxidoreductase [Salsuginibacillus halophilus]PSL42607.1 pyruvate/2-oxoglutarate dehydrogenase complex dihydrolipoamide dehydrogenase (E3) component [Salsuginibacillus halophilus]